MSAAASTTPAAKPGFFGLELLDNRFPALHGLRVFAILSVVQFHVTWIFAGEQNIKIDQELASWSLTIFFGMDLFFILSGFLIGSILLHSLKTSGSQNLRRFYIRRASRTFPPYYLVLTIIAALTPLTAMQAAHLKYEYVYATNFVSLQRKDILMFWGWSLALEEQFYLTVPLLFLALWKLSSDKARVVLLVGLWLAALAMRLVLFYAKAPWTDLGLYEALYFRPHTRFDTLVAGVLLAFVYNRWRDPIRAWLADPFHRAMVALPSLGCLWLLLRPNMFGDHHVQLVHVFAWGSVTSLMYFGPLLMLLLGEGPIVRYLSAPIFRRIATLGYGVYLVHIPVCDHVLVPMAKMLEARSVPMFVIWPISLFLVMALSLTAGYLLHVFVEKPSLALRDRLAA